MCVSPVGVRAVCSMKDVCLGGLCVSSVVGCGSEVVRCRLCFCGTP